MKVPEGLPPIPEGYVYLGPGPHKAGCYGAWRSSWGDPSWDLSKWSGNLDSLHYIARRKDAPTVGTTDTSDEPPLSPRDLVALSAFQGLLASGRPVCDEVVRDAFKGADKFLAARKEVQPRPQPMNFWRNCWKKPTILRLPRSVFAPPRCST